ncbi:hypothetical protein AB9K26_05600 [Psychroserpens sp. XS_ASV72]|uniref:hypothetical protein n=1 Tax=Psychroserpens sp. XS_ASV72 TaxID=3241293 RepID=UPI0035116EB5
MKQIPIILLILLLVSCGKDKVVLLPEIQNAKITKVIDVSPAYLFYDETQPDSIKLNRKNLISTTNWLVNVDKRLTLEQAIPKIKFLQDKKRNAEMHKNENAKNYFTCNDTSIQNLGFIEFTDVFYIEETIQRPWIKKSRFEGDFNSAVFIDVKSKDSIDLDIINPKQPLNNKQPDDQETILSNTDLLFQKIGIDDLSSTLNSIEMKTYKITLGFHKKISFQDYITIKSVVIKLKSEGITIDNNEFIY